MVQSLQFPHSPCPEHGSCVRLRVVHDYPAHAKEAQLYADGYIVDPDTIMRSELLDDMLQTDGETRIPILAVDWHDWVKWPHASSDSALSPQRLVELLQVATFLIDEKMAAEVSEELAQTLRIALRNDGLDSWALSSLPAAFTSQGAPSSGSQCAIQRVLGVLGTMKDYALAGVLQHMHLSELLRCPESLRELAVASKLNQGCVKLRQQLAWHPRCRERPPASSYFSKYVQHITQLPVEKLDLSANGISESDVPLLATVIAALTSMKSLDLSGNPINDSSGACCHLIKHCIQRCMHQEPHHNVAHIKLPASVLSTAPEPIVLDLFESMQNLKTLDISGSILTETMCTTFASCLRHMTGLQHLGLWGVMLWGQGGTRSATMVIGDRQRHPQTAVPVCSMMEHVNGVFENLLELRSLEIGPTTAHLRNAGVTDAVFMSLPNLPKLQSLRICARHVSCHSIYLSLSRLADLQTLTVSNASCLSALLTPLRHCMHLSVLHAQRTVCRALGSQDLAGLTQLQELHLDLTFTRRDALNSIAWQIHALRNLKVLEASIVRAARWQHDWSPSLHSFLHPALHAVRGLTALHLPPCPGSELPQLVHALRALPALRQLSLLRRSRELPLQPALLAAEPQAAHVFNAAVAALRQLHTLELPFCTLADCSAAAATTLPCLTQLTRLVLAVADTTTPINPTPTPTTPTDRTSNNTSKLASVTTLGAAIAGLPGLQELGLQFPDGSSAHLVALVAHLSGLRSLQWLEMQGLHPPGVPKEHSDVMWENLKGLPLHAGIVLH